MESGFDPNVVGSSGDVGIAQFLPSTASGLGINPYDPLSSLQGAAQMDGRNLRKYGDEAKAFAAYNCGGPCVDRAIRLGGWNWQAYIPATTQHYIQVILG
jgi:soluble lytic murein transglycosylase-like protein